MPLLDSQSALLLDLIKRGPFPDIGRAPLPPTDFTYYDTAEGGRVSHRDLRFYFRILSPDAAAAEMRNVLTGGGFAVVYSPGDAEQTDAASGYWGQLIPPTMGTWLNNLSRECAVGDPWAELAAQKEVLVPIAEGASTDNTPFTPQEQTEIAASLDALREYITANTTLTVEQLSVLRGEIESLKQASAEVGRHNWVNQLKGFIFTMVVQAMIPPEVVRQGVYFAVVAIGHIVGHVVDPSAGNPELL
jgi:hypothetical protein